MFKELMQQAFELDKLKHVYRESDTLDGSKKETSAEHSWQCATLALLLREYGDSDTDIDRVLKMLVVHDIGEIQAGDVSHYDDVDGNARFEAEYSAIKELLGSSPDLVEDWLEFENGDTLESRYARAVDRISGVLSSLFNQDSCWSDAGMTVEKILNRNEAIKHAFPGLWPELVELVQEANEQGRIG